MKKHFKIIAIILAIMIIPSIIGIFTACNTEIKKIYLITTDYFDSHWLTMNEGALKALDDYKDKNPNSKVEFYWRANSAKCGDESSAIYDAIDTGADVIIHAGAAVSAAEVAMARGIKVIYADYMPDASKIDLNYIQYVYTCPEASGILAGEKLVEELKNKEINNGKIGIVSYEGNSDYAKLREKGFKTAVEAKGYETEIAIAKSEEESKEKATEFYENGCIAVFGVLYHNTLGVALAAAEANGRIACGVGAVYDESLLFIIVEDPYEIGYKAMESAILIAQGKIGEITKKTLTIDAKILTKDDLS